MARQLLALVLMALVAAMATCQAPVTPAQMASVTQFVRPSECDPSTNSYSMSVRNGFSSNTTFIIQLVYPESASQSNQFSLGPFSISSPISVYPLPPGGVGNRLAQLKLVGSNPTWQGGSFVVFSDVSLTCGTVVQNEANQDCGWFSYGCLITNGYCISGFACWLIIYVAEFLIAVAIICAVAFGTVYKVQRDVLRTRSVVDVSEPPTSGTSAQYYSDTEPLVSSTWKPQPQAVYMSAPAPPPPPPTPMASRGKPPNPVEQVNPLLGEVRDTGKSRFANNSGRNNLDTATVHASKRPKNSSKKSMNGDDYS